MTDKRYSLVIPQELYDEVERVAVESNVTVIEILRQYIKLGLMVNGGKVNVTTKDGNEVVLL